MSELDKATGLATRPSPLPYGTQCGVIAVPFAFEPGDSDSPAHVAYRASLWRRWRAERSIAVDPWLAGPSVVVEHSAECARLVARALA